MYGNGVKITMMKIIITKAQHLILSDLKTAYLELRVEDHKLAALMICEQLTGVEQNPVTIVSLLDSG